jgi:hypothetical protein
LQRSETDEKNSSCVFSKKLPTVWEFLLNTEEMLNENSLLMPMGRTVQVKILNKEKK